MSGNEVITVKGADSKASPSLGRRKQKKHRSEQGFHVFADQGLQVRSGMRYLAEKTHDCVPVSRVAVLVICKSCLMSPSNILSSTCLEPHERHG